MLCRVCWHGVRTVCSCPVLMCIYVSAYTHRKVPKTTKTENLRRSKGPDSPDISNNHTNHLYLSENPSYSLLLRFTQNLLTATTRMTPTIESLR